MAKYFGSSFTRILLCLASSYYASPDDDDTTLSPEAIEFIHSDWRHVFDTQIQALPEPNNGILDKASAVVDEIMAPVETVAIKVETEATGLVEGATSFLGEISGILTLAILLVLMIGIVILIIHCTRNSRHHKKMEEAAIQNMGAQQNRC